MVESTATGSSIIAVCVIFSKTDLTGECNMKNSSAFTLIELLVVVLIIGILAAVALPQYQVAVLKSRLAPIMANVKAIVTSSEVYYLQHGEYPDDDDITGIDLGIDGCVIATSKYKGTFFCPTAEYDFGYSNEDQMVIGFTKPKMENLLSEQKKDYLGVAYVQYPQRALPANKRGTHECWAETTNTVANKVCLSLNGTKYGDTIEWHNNIWNKYNLP